MAPTCVALVDDEASLRVALGRLLRLAGHDVAAFASGDEFLSSLDTRVPDCALLDIHMPGLSGLQVQARLKAAQVNLPVVFITADDDAELARSALAAGGLRVLRKPFANAELLAAVDLALQCRR